MTEGLRVVPARFRHCGLMIRDLRRVHLDVANHVFGTWPRGELQVVVGASSVAHTWLYHGQPIAMFGVIGTFMSTSGFIWFTLAERATPHYIEIMRHVRWWWPEIIERWPLLTTYILDDDTRSVTFATRLGFTRTGPGDRAGTSIYTIDRRN